MPISQHRIGARELRCARQAVRLYLILGIIRRSKTVMTPTKSRISLRGLRTFCVAAQRGSFRLAAQELYLTPSAISHQVKSLESELDVKLFDRSLRDLRLTEAGSTLLNESGPLIAQLDQVASRFHARLVNTHCG